MKMKKGFSIAEVIISLFVITVGLVTVLGLIASSIRESAAGRNRIIGAQLAQEGFELVRNIRDNNVLSDPDDFDIGLETMAGVCIDITINTASNPDLNPCDYELKYDPNAHFYSHYSSTATDATPFSRKINMTNNGTEINVASYVWWDGSADAPSPCNSANKCALVQNNLAEHP